MQKRKFWYRRVFWLLLCALIVPFLVQYLPLWRFPKVLNLELIAYSYHCRTLSHLKPDPRLILVGMDDESLPRMGRYSYPLPRSMQGRLVAELQDAGAKVIGFDVYFTARAPEAENHDFAAALRKQGKVIAALGPDLKMEPNGTERVHFLEPEGALRPYLIPGAIIMPRSYGNEVRWFFPYPVDDETTGRYLALPVALVSAYYGEANREPLVRNTFQLGQIQAPIGLDGEILIRYAGPPDTTFPYVPYSEVYNGTWKQTRGAGFFRDKIVLIGRISAIEDRQGTPLGVMQGVEILANITQMLLEKDYIRHWGEFSNFLTKLGLCLLLAMVFWRAGVWGGLVCTLLEILAWPLVTNMLFVRAGIWADMVEPIVSVAVMCVFTSLADAARLRLTFNSLMPNSDAAFLLSNSEEAGGRTSEREVTIVFCDLRRYTDLSETLPSAVVELLLHRFLEAGERIAGELGGDLDKIVGDEMMLRFEKRRKYGEPHALRAVRWALKMQEFAANMDKSGEAGEIGFRIGIGISTGAVRVGTVKAQKRIQATAIGDAVNVASRLQNATKEVQRPILMGPDTYTQVREFTVVEPLGEISVKGKQVPLRIYCPLRIK